MSYLSMTLSASLMILCVLLIRKLFVYKVPSFIFTMLWILVLIRLCVPYKAETSYNIYNVLYFLYFFIKNRLENPVWVSVSNLLVTLWQNDTIQTLFFVIWLMGVLFVSYQFFKSHISVRKIQKEALPLTAEKELLQLLNSFGLTKEYALREIYGISSPLSCGIIHPMIVLPKDFAHQNPQLLIPSLLHEYMHLRYHHPLIQYVLIILCIINWFNPFIWLLYKYINQDMEIACDRGALKHLGEDYKENYALHLVRFAEQIVEQPSTKTVFYHSYTRGVLKERIVAITKFKKLSIITIIISVLLPCGVASALGTSDNYILEHELSDEKSAMSIVSIESPALEQDISKTDIFVPWENLAPYVAENKKDTRAPSKYIISEYAQEYPPHTPIPQKITVTTQAYGYTYKGTLNLSRISVQETKTIAYYTGTVYLQ